MINLVWREKEDKYIGKGKKQRGFAKPAARNYTLFMDRFSSFQAGNPTLLSPLNLLMAYKKKSEIIKGENMN